jgi:hypothetical protein
LTEGEVRALLAATTNIRDFLLIQLMVETGVFSRGQSPCASVVL